MTKYIISGGTPLTGSVALSGAKNSGFKLMIAALLANSPSQISNLGMISEIDLTKDNIFSLGGQVRDLGNHSLEVDPVNLNNWEISKENGEKSRSCTYYIPILLHKFGKAVVPLPGGDKIATRPLDRHFDGLKAMGAQVEQVNGVITAVTKERLKGTTYRFAKNTHGGTDTLLLAAVKAKGQTILENCALDPEIDNLIEFLNCMGGKIIRNGRTITINGVDSLAGSNIKIIPDRNEAITFACAALGTKGNIAITNCIPEHLKIFLEKIQEIGGLVEIGPESVRISYNGTLRSTNVETKPCPGFMTDWQPLWTALMTQANGESVIHETIHESRFGFVPLLLQMGAKIELFNPPVSHPDEVYGFNLADDKPGNFHAAKVFGPTPLAGAKVETKDVRAGATMMLSGMMVSGETEINDPLDQIKRGYENLPGKLIKLGAKIQVIAE